MEYKYKTKGVCASQINININDGLVEDVSFVSGCNGNLKGIAALVKGRSVDEVIDVLSGIKCNFKNTSCPDQLAKALESIKANEI